MASRDDASYPQVRRLRGYAFDPSLSLRLDTVAINHTVFQLPWEHGLAPGPRGEYLEVVDYDPASGCWYEPVDLNDLHLVAQDGVAPSQGSPQFHQQMVYAVAQSTIGNFEKALGRRVLWSPRDMSESGAPSGSYEQYVRTLRIYPHALRAANAYYSPEKKALLFGYFEGPAGMVFTCLSHDIIAHETTHALLDGMHRRYIEDNHPDTWGFHEAFADLVALFQHFMFPQVLVHQIARTRGDLQAQSLLGELAQEFGVATGRYGALRSAIGTTGTDGVWRPVVPDPQALARATEPHERGAILVAAVFAAFLAIYKVRSQRILVLASGGTGIMPQGALPPAVVEALAAEANKTAASFLHMCIRALDYCPPFDITFGDYLRALVTADFDMVPDDRQGYRVALVESFRRWGIVPDGIKTLSEEQLRWPYAGHGCDQGVALLEDVAAALRRLLGDSLFLRDREQIFDKLRDARRQTHGTIRTALGLSTPAPVRDAFMRVTGLDMIPDSSRPGLQIKPWRLPSFEVHSVLPALRINPEGQLSKQLIITLTQRQRNLPVDPADSAAGSFDFRGGCTLVFGLDGDAPALRYAIVKPIDDPKRLEAIRAYRKSKRVKVPLRATYFDASAAREPFCALHADD